jgi:antitoxin FitA
MGNLQIKNLPEELHDELRQRAEVANMTVRDYVLQLIRRDLAVPSKAEWLERLATRASHEGTTAAEVLAEERSRR